jgi:hypothetical protein
MPGSSSRSSRVSFSSREQTARARPTCSSHFTSGPRGSRPARARTPSSSARARRLHASSYGAREARHRSPSRSVSARPSRAVPRSTERRSGPSSSSGPNLRPSSSPRTGWRSSRAAQRPGVRTSTGLSPASTRRAPTSRSTTRPPWGSETLLSAALLSACPAETLSHRGRPRSRISGPSSPPHAPT